VKREIAIAVTSPWTGDRRRLWEISEQSQREALAAFEERMGLFMGRIEAQILPF
jgi:hypothetical protein